MKVYFVEWIDEFGELKRKKFYSFKEADKFSDELLDADYSVRQYSVNEE